MSRKQRKKNGFTLIELTVVIAIISILASIAIPQVGAIRERASRAKCLEALRIVGVGLHSYAADNNGAFPTDDTAQAAFRKLYVVGNVTNPMAFDCSSTQTVPTGTPGANLSTPSTDLTGVDFQYNTADLTEASSGNTVIVSDKSTNHTNPAGYNVLYVDGAVGQSTSAPSGTFG